jgi:ABC-2 type transport system ATP-binding protein
MLLGLVRPTSGTGTVLGEPLERPERYLGRVGALVEGPALWPALTAVQNLLVLARLGGHDPVRIPAVLDLVGLADRADDRFGQYSLGMKQRLGIAAALLGDPDLLVLDEPTAGLDPEQRLRFRDLVSRAGEGRAVLLSTHQTEDVAALCRDVVVLHEGRVQFQGPPAQLASLADGKVWYSDVRDTRARLAWRLGNGRYRNLGEPPAAAEVVEPTLEDGYLLLVGRDDEVAA